MKISELFVNLGIKGADTTAKSLGAVRQGMSEVASVSLEAKAAILAVAYAIINLTSSSANTGTNLKNIHEVLGIDIDMYQRYAYAASLAGASAEEFQSNVSSLANKLKDLKLGKGAPEWLQQFTSLTKTDWEKLKVDPNAPLIIIQKYQELFKSGKVGKELFRDMLEGFGITSQKVQSALIQGLFRPDIFKSAPVIGSGAIESLNKTNILLTQLGNKVKMFFANFTAKHGEEAVSMLIRMGNQFERIYNIIEKIGAQKGGAWGKLAESIRNFGDGISFLIDKIEESLGTPNPKAKDNPIQKAIDDQNNAFATYAKLKAELDLKESLEKNKFTLDAKNKLKEMLNKPIMDQPYFKEKVVAPQVKEPQPKNESRNHNLDFNQNIYIQGEAKDRALYADAAQRGFNIAYKQIPLPQVT